MNLVALYSEGVLILSALFLLIVGVFLKWQNYRCLYWGAMAALALAFYATFLPNDFLHQGSLIFNPQVLLLKRFVLALSATVFLFSVDLKSRNSPIAVIEYPVLFLISITGVLLTVSSGSFLMLYLGLELQVLPVYIMVALDRDNLRGSESALKYYVLGSMSSALMLYGVSILYGITGSLYFHDMASMMNNIQGSVPAYLTVVLGILSFLSGLIFKISSFPMHVWLPSVYRGTSSVVVSFVSVLPKIAAFVAINRFLSVALSGFVYYQYVYYLFCTLAAISMLVGFLGAISQRNIRSFLAFSSIQQMGYVLLLVSTTTAMVFKVVLSYMFVYATLMIGVLACLARLMEDDRKITELNLEDMSGLIRKNRFVAVSLAVFLFSMAGIPPMAGFFTKFYLLSAAFSEGMALSVVWAAIMSVAAMYYYLRLVKVMFFDPVSSEVLALPARNPSLIIDCLIISILVFNVGLIIKPDFLLQLMSL